MMRGSSHFGADGAARMVDVADKPATDRTATARARIEMQPSTLAVVMSGTAAKGDVLGVARIAGIMAAKRTAELIPLCHPLPIAGASIEFIDDAERSCIEIIASCRVTGATGVEMEALTAASIAALTIYDMCKSLDRGMRITDLRLTHKAGGRSGTFEAP